MNRLPDAEKTPPPRVILLDGGLGERLRPLALAWAGLGQTLAIIGVAGESGNYPMDTLDLQLAIERAGGICLALERGDSPEGLCEALGHAVDALGGIDLVAVSGADRSEALLAAMDGLVRRVRPGWILAGSAPQGGSLDDLPPGARVAWVMDGRGTPEAVASAALEAIATTT